jgi:hypothetical protein
MIKHYAVVIMRSGEVEHRKTVEIDNTSISAAFDSIREKIEPLFNSVQCELRGIYFYREEIE